MCNNLLNGDLCSTYDKASWNFVEEQLRIVETLFPLKGIAAAICDRILYENNEFVIPPQIEKIAAEKDAHKLIEVYISHGRFDVKSYC